MEPAGLARFDGWTLQDDSGELRKDGRTVRLQVRPLQVLQVLLARPGEIVRRDELIARLWPKGIVDFDTALNSTVRRLRRALGDDADVPRYIETLPRRGYRFIAAIDAAAPAGADATPSPAPSSTTAPPRMIGAPVLALLLVIAITAAIADRVHDRAALVAEPLDAVTHERAATATQPQLSSNPQARLHYRRARLFYQRRAAGDLLRARDAYQRALLIDPDFATAYAALASTYWMLVTEQAIPRDTGLAKLRAAAEHALVIDPSLAEAHYRLANAAWLAGDKKAHAAHARQAAQLEPEGALALSTRSSDALVQGRIEESIQLARRAVAAEPVAPNYQYNLAWTLLAAGRLDEARQANLDALQISPSHTSEVIARVMILQGQFQEAIALVQQWPDGIERRAGLALAYQAAHRKIEADAALAELIEAAAIHDPLRIAEVYAYRNDAGNAVRWLDAGTVLFQNGGDMRAGVWPWMLRLSPFVSSLASDPRWQAWLVQMAPQLTS